MSDGVCQVEEVGITRRHSVPLQPDVIISNDVIHHQLSDVITSPPHTRDDDDDDDDDEEEVTIHPSQNVTLGHKTSIIVKQEGGPSFSSSNATKIITLSTTTSTSSSNSSSSSSRSSSTPIKSNATTTATFHLEPDWREAAHDAVLTIRCKKTTAELVKAKFGSGSRGKCILLGKQWFTPTEFEAHCGRSASKDWKRSIRFQGQSLLTLVEEGYLQVHATSCSCGACLDDDAATGSVRLHRPYKRKKRDRFFLETDKTLKQDMTSDHASPASATPTTVTLPMSGLGDLTVVPGILMGEQAAPDVPTTPPVATTTTTVTGPTTGATTLIDPTTLPLDKAWEHMNEVLLGLERSVGEVREMLGDLKERCQQEGLTTRHKLRERGGS
ncbi:hypothetical protein Pmani_010936 [Petrolisthes manimaculis]|uniref:SAND domain-containing protein n=1 Tax=Petrolisthes manimaculis TaxID=1843537 RepID=A0AAE1UF03_9EUCA|nr:hypothetical protein Pmani_010936 [Petrolisthes manimaculis]